MRRCSSCDSTCAEQLQRQQLQALQLHASPLQAQELRGQQLQEPHIQAGPALVHALQAHPVQVQVESSQIQLSLVEQATELQQMLSQSWSAPKSPVEDRRSPCNLLSASRRPLRTLRLSNCTTSSAAVRAAAEHLVRGHCPTRYAEG